MKLFIVSLLVTTVVLGVVGYLLFDGRLRFNYPDKGEFPVRGIDISHHQGHIRWKELANEDISFVIIKATEGGDYRDPLFQENWKNSRAAGYKTGAYHFYRLCKNGKEQASNFIEAVPYHPESLPPTVDLEFGGNCKTDKSKEQILAEVEDFLQMIEKYYKKKPFIYVTNEFYNEYLTGQLTGYPIWIRDIFQRPKLKDGREWLIWQYANRGHLSGIDTYVDLNALNAKTLDVLE